MIGNQAVSLVACRPWCCALKQAICFRLLFPVSFESMLSHAPHDRMHRKAHRNLSAGEATIRAQFAPHATVFPLVRASLRTPESESESNEQMMMIGRMIRLGFFCNLPDKIERAQACARMNVWTVIWSHVFSSFRQCAISSSP